MSNKILLAPSCPVTQSREAVASLIAFFNQGQEPAEMPAFFRLTAEMVLVRSNKGDAYYVVTPRTCSCPAAAYRPGNPCKHQRKFFPAPKVMQKAADAGDSIRPTAKWVGGYNGPVEVA